MHINLGVQLLDKSKQEQRSYSIQEMSECGSSDNDDEEEGAMSEDEEEPSTYTAMVCSSGDEEEEEDSSNSSNADENCTMDDDEEDKDSSDEDAYYPVEPSDAERISHAQMKKLSGKLQALAHTHSSPSFASRFFVLF